MKQGNLHIFRPSAEDWEVDSCEPLKRASELGHLVYKAFAHGDYPGDRLESGMLPELRNIGLWDSTKDQNWGLDWHRNEGIEFTFVLHGGVTFQTNQLSQHLEAGQLAITPPWVRHRLGDPHIGPSKLLWVILDVQVRRPNDHWVWPDWVFLTEDELSQLKEIILNANYAIPVEPEMAATLSKLLVFIEDNLVVSKTSQLKVYINQLLLDILGAYQRVSANTAPKKETNPVLKTVEVFLEELPNYLQIPWTVDNMAYECGVGKSLFTKYVKQKTNHTPLQYLNELRLTHAAERLKNGEGLVKDIALDLGYRSSEYFCKCFRKKFGVSPSQFV